MMANYKQTSVNNFESLSVFNSPVPMDDSRCIRSEIDRFESVHPSIYSIYELLEEIKNQPHVQSQIRDHIMVIEDAFVNSQEWTMSRSVLDIRIGILGSLSSGKSSLVHRFLTGTYMQDESPEGGRFKKEVLIDNQNYLLLIRDEANAPDCQLTHWVDGIIFVFSLENEESFKMIYQYFTKMCHYRNMSDVPFILVGTQDGISESHPRVIYEDRIRKLTHELKRCPFYETCATYGFKVEDVFTDVCQRIIQHRYGVLSLSTRSITPQQHSPMSSSQVKGLINSQSGPSSSHAGGNLNMIQTGPASMQANYRHDQQQQMIMSSPTPNLNSGTFLHTPTLNGVLKDRNNQQTTLSQTENKTSRSMKEQIKAKSSNPSETLFSLGQETQGRVDQGEQLTPTSTPTQKRKEHKRRSNIFTPGKKDDDKHKVDRLGHGRAIPIKQGFLYKKGTNSINRDWKKKYVVLLDDGRIIYHPSFHEYENDAHGKEIVLQRTTIKIPGMNKPRSVKTTNNDLNSNVMTANDHHSAKIETPNSKKRHRRQHQNHASGSTTSSTTSKSASSHNGADDDGDENIFVIVSLDKQWFFEAQSSEERDEWVLAIEQQILLSLQNIESAKAARAAKTGGAHIADASSVQAIKFVAGNGFCADCEQLNPTWASLNLGSLICMECAAVHRNLGTHLSRVRSLELDEWTSDLVQIMRSIGNQMVNSIWEANMKNRSKPQPNAVSQEREKWIRDKYEQKLFLLPSNMTLDQTWHMLRDAINEEDLSTVIFILAHGKVPVDDLNNSLIHLAAAKGNVTILQLLIWNGADPFVVDQNGLSPLQCANSDCIQTLQNLTNNRSDAYKVYKNQISVSPIRATVSIPKQSISSPGPPYDKLPSTVI